MHTEIATASARTLTQRFRQQIQAQQRTVKAYQVPKPAQSAGAWAHTCSCAQDINMWLLETTCQTYTAKRPGHNKFHHI